MQPFSSFPRPSFFAAALGLLAAVCMLGACDRHSAADLPESYGHGSGHQKAFDRHEPDSLNGSKHFSDSQGIAPGAAQDESTPAPTPQPGETASAPMFPSGN